MRDPAPHDPFERRPGRGERGGRAMLAALPREQVLALFPDASSFALRTGLGPSRPAELRALLREVRARGYAVEDGEVTPGMRSVGAAVTDAAGWPVAAIASTWATDAAVDEADAAHAVVETAAELRRRLHG